ncbi:MAG TPA: lipid-A-disaccharide synthase [Steroidobacteraceae bacterium]|nr:lipid-A-disaccharide synthase [Steroidobacteraceae bacterium]
MAWRAEAVMGRALTIGMVAGEASGDLLGAALIGALREHSPDMHFIGLSGERMRAAGCESLGDSEELAVMGLVEPLRHLPRLLRLRSRLRQEFLRRRVDVFIGVDAPAFNLGLARSLKRRGLATVQYVSPQVWAWRPGRVPAIAAAVDAVLCLLPFEPGCYAGHAVRAEFVGHPLADQIPTESQRASARQALGLNDSDCVIAILPGSRMGEVQRLGADFAAAARLLSAATDRPVVFLAPMASPAVAAVFEAQRRAVGVEIRLLQQGADQVLAAADAALVASGTATLQSLLHGCPMAVAYRLAPLTAFLVRSLKLVRLRHFSLPNLLAGEELVQEFFQQDVRPAALAASLQRLLTDATGNAAMRRRFDDIHRLLRRNAAARAARVVLELGAARAAA